MFAIGVTSRFNRLRNIVALQGGRGIPQRLGPVRREPRTLAPESGGQEPLTSDGSYKVTGRSILRPLKERSLVVLRMRAIFGLSARTEILRTFRSPLTSASPPLGSLTSRTIKNAMSRRHAIPWFSPALERTVHAKSPFLHAHKTKVARTVRRAGSGMSPRDWNAVFSVVGTILRIARMGINARCRLSSRYRNPRCHRRTLKAT